MCDNPGLEALARRMEKLVQDLLGFISVHSAWAGPVMFLACFGESLAVVSFFFPGTALLLATGALIPAGVVDPWSVVLGSIVGATLGDGVSYWIGKRFGGAVERAWPFTRNPDLLRRGIELFELHGGKSVFIGRFFGPARAVIPLAAGVMRMPAGRFWVANATSAIVWAPALLVPGALLSFAADTVVKGRTYLAVALVVLFLLGGAGAWIARTHLRRRRSTSGDGQE